MDLYITHLVTVYGVIMFDRVDFGHREGNSKPNYGYREGLHSTFLEDLYIGSNRRLIPERQSCI